MFRDEEELAADADLSQNIRRALEASRLLAVLCSPRAAESSFVDEEIRYFKELGRADHILAMLIAGEPNAKNASLECLPRSLRFGVPRAGGGIDWDAPAQPIAADARPDGSAEEGWTTAAAYQKSLEERDTLTRRQVAERVKAYEQRLELAKLKVIAGALGLPLGELTRRNQLFALAKARRRTRVLASWLAVVTVLGILAVIAGVVALRNQQEAELQTRVAQDQRKQATLERDRALRESYLNIVRRASAQVSAGELAAARRTLLEAPPAGRQWEWWYLIARCGPAPVSLNRFAQSYPERAAAIKAQLDATAVSATGNGDVMLDYLTSGRGGQKWQARRVSGNASILLNAFRTGMYGELAAILLGEQGMVFWRNGGDDDPRSPPQMASGEHLDILSDYVGFLRERYIVGNIGTPAPTANDSNDFELATWPDAPADEERSVGLTRGKGEQVLISSNVEDALYRFDPATSALSPASAPPTMEMLWAPADRQTPGELDPRNYTVVTGRGPSGPLILSSWHFGNVRLRDGATGKVIGESLGPAKEIGLPYAASAAVVPGTELVAGSFWWENKIIAGVVALRENRVLTRFENAPDMNAEYATWVQAAFRVSPDGSEAVLRTDSRKESYFAVWNVKSGKLVYGPADSAEYKNEEEAESETPIAAPPAPKVPLPVDYAWHPNGEYVAIAQPSGVTELRRNFATAPFAILEGVDASGRFEIQPLDATRVVIGNAVVDTTQWETVITLPRVHLVASSGDQVVVEARQGVIEIVRLGLRRGGASIRDALLLAEIRTSDVDASTPRSAR